MYRRDNGHQVAADSDYDSRSYWADFTTDGRLVTTCEDGFIRLYDAQFQLMTKAKAPGGQDPFSAVFSPDGKRIAVGFTDSTQVNVLSAHDLSLLYAPDTEQVDNGEVSSVAWSQDGSWLYAGGQYDDGTGIKPILKWSESGRGQASALAASNTTIMHLISLTDGSLVYGSYDPAFGVFDAQDRKRLSRQADIADFRGRYG